MNTLKEDIKEIKSCSEPVKFKFSLTFCNFVIYFSTCFGFHKPKIKTNDRLIIMIVNMIIIGV